MSKISYETSKTLNLYLLLAQYPMLASRIREQMRAELFHRGIITVTRFEEETLEHARQSQQREGLTEESADHWEERLEVIRGQLTEFYFAYNLTHELLVRLIEGVMAEKSHANVSPSLMFNPELAPLEMVLKQAEKYEALPPEHRQTESHHLQELIVVLLKSLVSDQLAFVRIAKRWFTAADFRNILAHRIGTGKIGGKAAGLLLAYKILQNTAPPEVFERIVLPRSYFVGAGVFYDFLGLNQVELLDQKYKSIEQIRTEYPEIQERYTQARFPEEIADQLRGILIDMGNTPLIVRSSSLLEDNFGTSFAGKYVSYFCPNQGTLKENLRDLTLAIRRVYASVYSPDALMYRRRMGLLDYDERMAILLQEVQGQRHRQYYFPTAAGVAYSYCSIIWNQRLRREDGFARLVMGLGTRAVDRVAHDYPRMIYLSHPQLRPEVTRRAIRYYSQHFVDMLDLGQNELVTQPTEEVLGSDFHSVRWVASMDDGDTIRPLLSLGNRLSPEQLVLTFDYLIQRSDFVPTIKSMLKCLAEQYQLPVDVEFAATLTPDSPRPRLSLHLLQCRPQNLGTSPGAVTRPVPANVPPADRIFACSQMTPQGEVNRVEYLVYVNPAAYHVLATPRDYTEVARLIGLLNRSLEEKVFILLGPGRWGSSDYLQGVPVTYADIFNARALVELASQQRGYNSEPSYGTHFFQDLVETQIYPLAINPDASTDFLNWDFLEQAADHLHKIIMREPSPASRCIKVIHIPTAGNGAHLELVMDGQRGLAYLKNTKGADL